MGEPLFPFYDLPLYRPPSESCSLIIQAAIGCSFNRCSFCSMYKSKTFRARPLAEVQADIAAAARMRPETRRVFLADGDALCRRPSTLPPSSTLFATPSHGWSGCRRTQHRSI